HPFSELSVVYSSQLQKQWNPPGNGGEGQREAERHRSTGPPSWLSSNSICSRATLCGSSPAAVRRLSKSAIVSAFAKTRLPSRLNATHWPAYFRSSPIGNFARFSSYLLIEASLIGNWPGSARSAGVRVLASPGVGRVLLRCALGSALVG